MQQDKGFWRVTVPGVSLQQYSVTNIKRLKFLSWLWNEVPESFSFILKLESPWQLKEEASVFFELLKLSFNHIKTYPSQTKIRPI